VNPDAQPVSSTLQETAFRSNILLYSCAQFFVLTILAMFVYPGGAKFDLDSRHYLFFQNFFSDLGATASYSGRDNLFSMALFIVALSTLGLGLIISAPLWKFAVPLDPVQPQRRSPAAFAAQIFVVVSGLCYIGVAITPWNLFLPAHNACVKGAFSLLLGFIVGLLALQLGKPKYKFYFAANCVYLVLLLTYVYLLFAGPHLDTLRGLAIQVVAQKIIAYVSIVNLALQAVGVRRNVALRDYPTVT
jgi:hypothetical protein